MSNVITLFANAEATRPQELIDFTEYLYLIKNGHWQDEVITYRAIQDPEERKAAKRKIIAVTPSGEFTGRGQSGLKNHSGLICIDVDDKDNEGLNDKVRALVGDPYVFAFHQSLGGLGYAIYFRIEPTKHLDAYLAIEKYLADTYHLVADKACKDVTRLRFVSFDPFLHKNSKEVPIFKKYLKKEAQNSTRVIHAHTSKDMEFIISQIRSRRIDLTGSYHDWIQIGFALADHYGEAGRDYFHAISEMHPEYNAQTTDAKYDNFLKTNDGSVGIATLFFKCKEHGIQFQTKETQYLQSTHYVLEKTNKDKTTSTENRLVKLAEQEGISSELAKEVSKQLREHQIDDIKIKREENVIPLIKAALEVYDIRKNEVTQEIEYKGKPMTTSNLNTIWSEIATALGTKCTQSHVDSLIHNDNTRSYNPFLDFFAKYQDREIKHGTIDRLVSTITARHLVTVNDQTDDLGPMFTQIFVRKWIISLIASMHGTYSLLILVLCGEQGLGKTNFFRWLLPAELRDYYGESKLDRGKDDEILMCRKLILCDDEFSGKSKNEYKLLKQYASTQFFNLRQPYGRKFEDYRRYAVLCGTSNENEVINDPTGNRRIIPINVIDIDFATYQEIDKIDLLMEAYYIWKTQKETCWQLTKGDIANLSLSTSDNEQVDTAAEALDIVFEKPTAFEGSWMTATEVRDTIMKHLEVKFAENRLGIALGKAGFDKKKKKLNDTPRTVYRVKVRKRFDAYGDYSKESREGR
jgi:predicted P-loop ATPase